MYTDSYVVQRLLHVLLLFSDSRPRKLYVEDANYIRYTHSYRVLQTYYIVNDQQYEYQTLVNRVFKSNDWRVLN